MPGLLERVSQAWSVLRTGRAAEALGGMSVRDQQLMAQGFRRLTQASSTLHPPRDLQPLAQDRMLQIVYYQWESNPITQWIIETTVDFILGEGFSIETEDDDLREVITAFLNDPVNQLDRRMDSFAREYRLYGELCIPVAVNKSDGHVRLSFVDPLEIDRVVADPENALITTAVLLKKRADGTPGKLLKVIRPDVERANATYGYLMPEQDGERDPFLKAQYDGACFLFQANKLSNGKRGRSDVLSLIDWADAYDTFLFDAMDAANLFNSFVYDVKLEGMSEAQMAEWFEKNKALKRGQMFVHNEKIELTAVVPDLKALDKDAFARLFRGHILGSKSFPEHWFGLAGEVNFASAKEMGLPPVKRLTRVQKELRYIISDLVKFQIHQAIVAKRIPADVTLKDTQAEAENAKADKAQTNGNLQPAMPPAAVKEAAKTKPADQCFRIVLPELSMKDQAQTVAAVVSLQTALDGAVGRGWLRGETASKIFAHLISQLGLPVDATEEFDPAGGDAMAAYGPGAQQDLERLTAQLERAGKGNGDNLGEPKRTTPRGGQPAAA